MKSIRHILLLLIFLPICIMAAEMDQFIVLDMRHGLKESRIRDIKHLPSGEVAIATTATIDIFDGNIFRSADILKSYETPLTDYNGFREIFLGPDSVLWLKNRKTLHAFQLPDLTPVTSIPTLLEHYGIKYTPINLYISNGALYTVSPDGNLYAYDGNTNRPIVKLPSSSSNRQSPQKIASDSVNLYLCYENGDTYIINRPTGKPVYSGKTPQSDKIHSYSRGINIKLHENRLYISRHNGTESMSELYVFDIPNLRWETTIDVPFRISDFAFNKQGNSFIIGKNGYIVYSPNFQILEFAPEISSTQGNIADDLSSIDIDTFDGIWIGTSENGLLYSNPQRRNCFKHTPSSFTSPIKPVFISEALKKLADTYAPGSTNCTGIDNNGFSYIGTRNGMMIVDSTNKLIGVINSKQGLTSENIQAIVTIHDCVYATTSNGIIRIKPMLTQSSGNASTINDPEISAIEITNYGILDGISLHGKEFRPRQLTSDSSGSIYAGYPEGMYMFHPDSILNSDRPHYILNITNIPFGSSTSYPKAWFYATLLALVLSLTLGLPFRNKPKTLSECQETALPLPKGSDEQTTSTTIDNEFVQKLTDLIITHIEDGELSVTQLSSMMAMDRTVLYRKTQANLEMSPSAYIKTIRIREAKRLLRETNLLIAEIALRTGFSTPKYFTQTFKEATSVTPTLYRQTHQHSNITN